MKDNQKIPIFILELMIIAANFFLVYFLLRDFKFFYSFNIVATEEMVKEPYSLSFYQWAFGAAFFIWAMLLWWRSDWEFLHIKSYGMVIRNLLVNGCIFFFCFTSVSFILKFVFLSRMFMITYAATCTFWLICERVIILHLIRQARRQGRDVRHILLAGTGRRAQEFISHLAKHTEWGYKLIGLLDIDPRVKGETIAGYPVVGTLEDLPNLLETEVVDETIFVTPRDWLDDVRKCILYCEAVGVPATISTDLFDLEIASAIPKQLEGKPFLTIETRRPRGIELFIKRVFDIIVSAMILIVLSPLLLIVALAVKLSDPAGPVFFRQLRSGRNGRKFYLYKFRSMIVNAEAKLEELRAKNEMSGPVFKITHDPRLTKIGKFLRKTSLDEFPQFWNVLKGDMSVVGPRPPLPSEVEKYEPWQRRRLSMKPGITCIWQVSGRNQIDFEEWMELDLRYIDNWSLWLDFKILLLTFKAVFDGSGK